MGLPAQLLSRHRGVIVVVLGLVVGACGAHNQTSSSTLAPVIGLESTVTSQASSVVPPDSAPGAAEVETAYGVYVECLEDAGMSGVIRFDLGRGTSFVQEVDIGPDAEAGTRRLVACQEPFDEILNAYAVGHPQTAAQREAIRATIVACADEFLPGRISVDGSFDDVVLAYNDLIPTAQDRSGAQACVDDAFAGTARRFGSP